MVPVPWVLHQLWANKVPTHQRILRTLCAGFRYRYPAPPDNNNRYYLQYLENSEQLLLYNLPGSSVPPIALEMGVFIIATLDVISLLYLICVTGNDVLFLEASSSSQITIAS